MSILTLLRQCQLVLKSHEWAIKAIQSDRLSSGMREVVDKAARVEHNIVGKILGMTASSFAPLQSRRDTIAKLNQKSSLDGWMCAVGGVAHAHMKTQKTFRVEWQER